MHYKTREASENCLWKIAMDRNESFPDNLWQQSDKHNGEINGEVRVCQISSAFQLRRRSDVASFKCGMSGKKPCQIIDHCPSPSANAQLH